MQHDVLVVGGGPAGLSAALILGRARKRVLLCDAGPPRNAAAEQIHSFVTRDGTPPREFRRAAHEELRTYPGVVRREVAVQAIAREGEGFRVALADGASVTARRVVLAVGVVDVLPELPGYRALWGRSVFQCPYCHGWEVQERAFSYLSPGPEWHEWGVFLTGWSRDVVVLTDGAPVDAALRERLGRAGVGLDDRKISRLVERDGALAAIEFADGRQLAREVLFARPPQRQTALVQSLGLELDALGFVRADAQGRTSAPGIHAAGDLTTMMQGAIVAAAAGMQAAAAINHELTMEQALGGAGPARPPAASSARGGTGG